MSKVAIIDYGMGNLHSIAKALQYADAHTQVIISHNPKQILTADRIVFPGVGAIKDCMLALKSFELDQLLIEIAKTKPLLGICLGMQALLTKSEENNGIDTLNILPGQVKHFPQPLYDSSGDLLKIPHMGWNQVWQQAHPLWKNINNGSRFYFVHSYYAVPDSAELIAATTEYSHSFACALAYQNIFAVQFHPEKSQTLGLQLLKNFLAWNGEND